MIETQVSTPVGQQVNAAVRISVRTKRSFPLSDLFLPLQQSPLSLFPLTLWTSRHCTDASVAESRAR